MTKRTLTVRDADGNPMWSHAIPKAPFYILWEEKKMTVAGPYKKYITAERIVSCLNDISYFEEEDKK